MSTLNGIGVPAAKVNTLGDVLEEPLLKKAFTHAKDARSGTEVVLPPLAEVSEGGLSELSFPPRLGEHNEAIYGGVLGYDSRQLSSLKARGII
jgi:crotonobetainyl-CoA:carnitine CoA-transferase CaiB-like acyl-CoA transferase